MDPRSRPRDAIPQRVLLVCADRTMRERMEADIAHLGIEAIAVEDERTALAQFVRQSFPVVICDHEPTAQGTELARQLRCIAIEPVYVLMMANEGAGLELEALYRAGIDQFMPRRVTAAVLQERVQSAFRVIAQRRMSRLGADRGVVVIDLAAGAHTARHLVGRLSAEMALAQASNSTLEIALIRVGVSHTGVALADELLAVLAAVQSSLRPRLDWMALLHPVGSSHRLAVVMPDAGAAGAAALEQHVRNAFALELSTRNIPELSFGHVLFEPTAADATPSALSLLARAEQQLRTVRSESAAPTPDRKISTVHATDALPTPLSA